MSYFFTLSLSDCGSFYFLKISSRGFRQPSLIHFTVSHDDNVSDMKCSWTTVTLIIVAIGVQFLKPCSTTFGTIQQSLASLLTGNANNNQQNSGGLFSGRLQQQNQFNQQQQNIPNGIAMTTQSVGGRLNGQQLQFGQQQRQTGLTINGAPATFGTNIGSFSANLQSNSNAAATFNSPNRQSMSARILDGLVSKSLTNEFIWLKGERVMNDLEPK